MTCTEKMPFIPNLMAIWYHDEHISDDMQHQMKIHLHQKFNYSRIFKCMKDFTDYLATPIVQHIIFIITSKQATHIQRIAQRRKQCLSIYQLPIIGKKSSTLQDAGYVHSKIKTSFDAIIDDLRKDKLSSENKNKPVDEETVMDDSTLPFGIFKSIPEQHSFSCLNKESLKFLLCQSLIELFVKMSYDKSAFQHMCGLCRMDYKDDRSEMRKIDKFEDDYDSTKAINYYTRDSFLFRVINRALRTDDVDRVYKFGCYLTDLYKQLEELGNQQRSDPSQTTKTVYRGKKLSTDILQQLKDNVGNPISMNGLLSTTENFNISTVFAGIESSQNGYQSVIFEMHIDNTTTNLIRPYANVSKKSAFKDENEVLFFLGFVWKIESMEETESKWWYIVLESCKDYDPDLVTYIENSKSECPLLTLGNILQELGDSANAKNFYQLITEDENFPDETRGHAHYNIAMLAADRGEYMDELIHLRQAEKLVKQPATPSIREPNPPRPLFAHDVVPSRNRILNNIGHVCMRNGKYEMARDRFKKALEEPGCDIDRAAVLNNYGLLEYQCRNYDKAQDYFTQAVQLARNDACITDFKDNLELANDILARNRSEAADTRFDTN